MAAHVVGDANLPASNGAIDNNYLADESSSDSDNADRHSNRMDNSDSDDDDGPGPLFADQVSITINRNRLDDQGRPTYHFHNPHHRQGMAVLQELIRQRDAENGREDNGNDESAHDEDSPPLPGAIFFNGPNDRQGERQVFFIGTPREYRTRIRAPKDARLHANRPRLTHYIKESNTGQGYIKEVSFTPDGRVICSPYGFGVRLLSFDEHCSDLADLEKGGEAKELHELGMVAQCHKNVVLSSCFSPLGCDLVTGCMDGKIVWHQPLIWSLA